MKTTLKNIFGFILQPFEKGNEPYSYKPLNRLILKVVGSLFVLLSLISAYFAMNADDYGYFLPVLVFFCVGFVALVVGFLGTDRAVSKIWGSR